MELLIYILEYRNIYIVVISLNNIKRGDLSWQKAKVKERKKQIQ